MHKDLGEVHKDCVTQDQGFSGKVKVIQQEDKCVLSDKLLVAVAV